MLNSIATVVVVVLGLHIITKFAFFALPYRRRRALLDKQYGDKPSATATSDLVLMAFTIAISALLLGRGGDAVSFLGGLWIGATLIQLYFHPISPSRAIGACRPAENVTDQGDVVRHPRCAVAPVAPITDADRACRVQPRSNVLKTIAVASFWIRPGLLRLRRQSNGEGECGDAAALTPVGWSARTSSQGPVSRPLRWRELDIPI